MVSNSTTGTFMERYYFTIFSTLLASVSCRYFKFC